MDDCRAVVAHDRSRLPAHGGVHEQEVTVAATGLTPYRVRDKDPAGQSANVSVAHGSLDDPGGQPRHGGFGQTEHGRQARQRGGDIEHELTVTCGTQTEPL
jgi:hypothetical protein